LPPAAVEVTSGPTQPLSVALIVDETSNPVEVGCACEVFGARRRADLGRELYQLRVVAPNRPDVDSSGSAGSRWPRQGSWTA
jgi:AraC family transcriptional activator FtrA